MALASIMRGTSYSQAGGMFAWLRVAGLIGTMFGASSASATVVNFDDLPHSGGAVLPVAGNYYAASGILFSSGTIPGTPMVNDVFTMTDMVNEFAYVSNSSSVSVPNLAGARDLGLQDTLFSFTTAIANLAMTSDSVSDGPTFRLLALESTGAPNTFRVLAVDEAVTGYQDALNLSIAGGFSFAAFQVTTEQEGFDDITFSNVPAPGSMIAFAAAGVAATRRRRPR
ncbi:MAG: hypothetical protein U0638_10070 [Phycisphaerales bacterium]